MVLVPRGVGFLKVGSGAHAGLVMLSGVALGRQLKEAQKVCDLRGGIRNGSNSDFYL